MQKQEAGRCISLEISGSNPGPIENDDSGLELLANITTVTGGGADLQAAAAMAGEALLPWVRQFDGYRGMLILADGESGTARFATFWEDEEALRRSEHGRAQVREQMAKTAGVEIESVQAYTVLLMDGFEAPSV